MVSSRFFCALTIESSPCSSSSFALRSDLARAGAVGSERRTESISFSIAALRCELLCSRCSSACGARSAAPQLGVRARDLEGEANHVVGCLPIGVEQQQITRLRGALLLEAERSIPVHRLIEDLDQLLGGDWGDMPLRGGRRGLRRRGLTRRGLRLGGWFA